MELPHTFFGTLREHYILLFSAAGSFGLLAGTLGAWLGARFGTRSALRREESLSVSNTATREDVRTLSDELHVLMVEVERIAEGQRFVTKLLAERGERAALPPAARSREPGSITPH